MVGEILDPDKGIFEDTMATIPSVCPTYETCGACEFPHPPEHNHPFPYGDGLDCLTGELSGPLDALPPPPGVPAISYLGLIVLALLLLIALTSVMHRRQARTEPQMR